MNDRDQIMANIRRGLNRGSTDDSSGVGGEKDFSEPRARLIPQRVQLEPGPLVDLFVEMAAEAAASVESLPALSAVPEAVAALINARALPPEAVVAPAPELAALPWATETKLRIRSGKASGHDQTSVTLAFAGIAETGTLMLVSGPATPTTLNFLPSLHIVVLLESRIVGPYEQAWDWLRSELGQMPRTVNFVTGPSRSGDIEQTLYMGAHGPLHVHILLIRDGTRR